VALAPVAPAASASLAVPSEPEAAPAEGDDVPDDAELPDDEVAEL
jgi:hypothetical protein